MLLDDKVIKVYIAAIKALRALLNFLMCHDEVQFAAIRGQVRTVLHSVLLKCAEANKRISEDSIKTLLEVAKGREGDMGIGRFVDGSFEYNGLDLILGVIFEDEAGGQQTWDAPAGSVSNHTWILARLILLDNLMEKFSDQFSLEAVNAKINFKR